MTDRLQRRVILLGSTGSIGTNVLKVVEHLSESGQADLEIIGLVAGAKARTLGAQARRFDVEHVALADARLAGDLGTLPHIYTGPDAATELVEAVAREGDLVVAAMVGSAGIPATLAAIRRGCDVALANKETLVAAGELVMPEVKRNGVHLLPIDSEHSALFQSLLAARDPQEVARVVLTASGGPFRTWSAEAISRATVQQALEHPTWEMGPKVTVDSASMMNKAMEVIEAHWMFDLPGEKIDVIVHPQSIIHGFVEFVDGSVVAQMGPPDMRTPIQYALTWPRRLGGCSDTMSWTQLREMTFEPVDRPRFPAVQLAYDVIEAAGTAGAVFNGANEAAVAAFLDGRAAFGDIVPWVREALAELGTGPVRGLEDVLAADEASRRHVAARIEGTISESAPGADADASAAYQSNRSS
ncbi:MAG: 1-deoxy-D-xylulose-5-phosphate reductoisomerase [Planctomycetota bacterium]|jgi:1-deoxy-D-xylulose-5-phosphate reductoisomerase